MNDPVKIGIAGNPASGKTTLALYPVRKDEKVLLIATNAVAYRLRGIPKEWVDGRVTIELPGFDETGKRKKGGDYFKAMLAYAARPKPEFTKIVIDDLTTMVRCRYNDALEALGGIPSEYRRENEAPQQFGFAFMEQIWQANKDSQIITLHHTKAIYKPGAEKELDTYWFELVGSKLDDTWAGRFDGFFYLETIQEKDIKNPRQMVTRRRLHLREGANWQFVLSRSGLGTPTFPATVDVTVRDAADHAPLEAAWQAMAAAVGGE